MTRRTGAASTWNPDNIYIHWTVVALLSAAVIAAGIGSIEGLILVAGWFLPTPIQWTLAVAIDVFLVGTALATLALRRRGAHTAAIACAVMTIILVTFSATANYLQVYTHADLATLEGQVSPWIKGSMPVLLLAAIEIVAALTSTKNNRDNSPLNRSKAEAKKLRAQLRELRKAGA